MSLSARNADGLGVNEQACSRPFIGWLPEQRSMIHFACPTCKSVLQVAAQKAGDKVACPKCSQRLLVPNPVKPAASNKIVLGSLLPSTVTYGGNEDTPLIPPTGNPSPAVPWIRCYDCGQPVPIAQGQRRDVKTGTYSGVLGDFSHLTNWFWGGVSSRVDLCPACAGKRDRTNRMQLWGLLAILVAAVLFLVISLLIQVISPRWAAD
jgi:DNA-directed RNA polymerase subunit RPC12/RpoP